MKDKMRIKVQVADVKHPMIVDPEEEPTVRKAARMVHDTYLVYANKYRPAQLPQSYIMAFAAIDIAVKYLEMDMDSNAEVAGVELQQLVNQLKEYLGD